jgi:outer membrane protein assembly factor BamB
VLDTSDGSVVWSRNAGTDTGTKVPIWGFAGSPLVLDDIVIVSAAGSLIAYDLATGTPRWSHHEAGDCYSSPHLTNIGGTAQILLQNETGTMSVSPSDGKLLWKHSWPGHPIVQPALAGEGDILLSADERSGVRRIAVSHGSENWTAKERWTSVRVRPYFNDSIIHNGHIFGFDGPSLACIDLNDGARKWKGGSYGRGQFILLADQDVLLVLSEKGEVALVNAVSERFTELARFPAIEGKTWNHPVLAGDILLVRNAQEMAAFRMVIADDGGMR